MSERIALMYPPYSDDVDAALTRMMPTGVAPIGLFRLFVRNLPMTDAMHVWGEYELGRQLSLPLREREIVIDRTCVRCGCEYEWGVHTLVFAEKARLTRDQVTSLVHGGPGDPCWSVTRERLLITAVDALHDTSDIDDASWALLAGNFDERQLLDLLLLSGWYHAIAFAARVIRVPLEPGAPRFADVAPAPDPAI